MNDDFTPITTADKVRARRLVLSAVNEDFDAANAAFAEAHAATDGLVHLSMCLADLALVVMVRESGTEATRLMLEHDITVLLDAEGRDDA